MSFTSNNMGSMEDISVNSDNIEEVDALKPVLCQDCQQEDLMLGDSEQVELRVVMSRVAVVDLGFHHRWKTFTRQDIQRGETHVTLCQQCKRVLRKPVGPVPLLSLGKPKKRVFHFVDVWPVYVWKLLTDDEMIHRFGSDAIHFVPSQWWKYWKLGLITDLPDVYSDCKWEQYLESVEVVVDQTFKKLAFWDILKHRHLGELKRGCDQYLRACVLCPWGCSGFLHDSGCLNFDTVISTYFLYFFFVGFLSTLTEKVRVVLGCQD